MKKFNIVLGSVLGIGFVTLILTNLIKAIALQDWLFVGLNIFIILALSMYQDIINKVKQVDRVDEFSNNLNKLMGALKDLKDVKEEDKNNDK